MGEDQGSRANVEREIRFQFWLQYFLVVVPWASSFPSENLRRGMDKVCKFLYRSDIWASHFRLLYKGCFTWGNPEKRLLR